MDRGDFTLSTLSKPEHSGLVIVTWGTFRDPGVCVPTRFLGWVVRPTPHPGVGLLGGWSDPPPTQGLVCWVGGLGHVAPR